VYTAYDQPTQNIFIMQHWLNKACDRSVKWPEMLSFWLNCWALHMLVKFRYNWYFFACKQINSKVVVHHSKDVNNVLRKQGNQSIL